MNAIGAAILIILGSNDGAAAAIEFSNMKACLEAKQQIEAYRGGANLRYGAICVWSYERNDKK